MPQEPDERPDDDQDPEQDRSPEPGSGAGGYRLGGSGSGSVGRGGSGGTGAGFGAGFGGLGGGAAPSSGSGGDPSNPLEALFASLAGGDTNALAAQLQSAFSMLGGAGGMFGGATGSSSGVNWEVTKDTARKSAAALGPDPTPLAAQVRAVVDAVALAEVWLDAATDFPRVGGSPAAWSRAEWIERTMPVWQRLVEPVATHIADAMAGALTLGGEDQPEVPGMAGMAGMAEMLRPMLRSSGASMFGLQLGQGLGQLSGEVVSTTDIGLPLTDHPQVALLPTNVAAFGEGLEESASDVLLYLTLRECARQRLFSSASWLRSQLLVLVEQYAAGITIDTSALEEAVAGMDPSNLEELGATLEGGLFEPQKTPEQRATLERLETMLALVEGWVDDVVSEATARWMPSAVALAETVRRRRATGGPAEATFATLVGLELRPRRLRDAANLWAAVRDARGAAGRDAVWSHPDLAPTSADLDDPLGFARGDDAPTSSGDADEEDFDAALAELLDEAGRTPEEPGDPGDPGQHEGDDPGPGRPA